MKQIILVLLSVMSVWSWAGDPVWIDVRTAEEFSSGHLEQVNYHIPHQLIGEQIVALGLEKDAEILLYCRSGKRAGMAKATLEQLGYTNIRNVGGLEDAREYVQQLTSE